MSINIENLKHLTRLETEHSLRKPSIVLNPNGKHSNEVDLDGSIIFDTAEWKMPEKTRTLVEELSQNNSLSNEDKILSIYKQLCENYVYDDNLISYIKKTDDDSYSLPDWYGRDIDEEWEKNREKHKRRVCYEVSRYLAKSLEELFKDNEDFDVCILWDKGRSHYFVGLTCNDYSVTLDLDDFDKIKDLTRIKMGLTAEGIVVLKDNTGNFQTALDNFNKGRIKDAVKKVEDKIDIDNHDDIVFLSNAIEILKNDNIDSQGLFEYIKEIVDIKYGPETREKVWKEKKGETNAENRYIRCLVLNIGSQKYLVDTDEMLLREFDERELTKQKRELIPYKELTADNLVDFRCHEERYNGG